MLPEEEHFIFENHHEPIISKETFKLAQDIRKRKVNTKSTSSTSKRNYYFSGLCRCGDRGFGVSGITITRIENTYKELEKDKTNRIEQLQKLLEKQQEDLDKEKIRDLKIVIEYFDDIIKSNEPNKYILECLIDKMWIYHDKSVKFELKPNIKKLI